MKIHNLILSTFFLLMIAGNVDAASFDCGKAATEIEKLICSDDELSRLDESLNKAYLQALERTDIKQKMIKSQRQWLKNELNACKNAECLKKACETRIKELGLLRPNVAKSQAIGPLGEAIQTEPGQQHESTLKRPGKSESEPSVNEQLLQAAYNGSPEQIKASVANGADVNARDTYGQTALMQAARRKNLEMVKLLVNKGADVNAEDHQMILMYAARWGNLAVMKFLIDKGADVNAKDNSGQTVLSLASAKNQPEIVRYLKAHGAKLSEVLTCATPGDDDFPEQGVVTFLNDHTVYHVQDGETETADALQVWNKNPKEMCFFITTVTNNYHTCSLGGKATAVRENEYSYTENKCHVIFIFTKDEARVAVTGPEGRNFCVPDDLDEDNGCGMNTYINSATYKKTKKKEKMP